MRASRAGAIVLALCAACTAASPRARLSPSPTPAVTRSPSPPPAVFDATRPIADVRVLAHDIGVRVAGSPRYDRAADFVAHRLATLGYRVERQHVPIPAGKSEGVAVPPGTSDNVLAYPPAFDRARPYLLAGAHLDTVAPSPGANDNASGVAALLELARLARLRAPRLAVVFAVWTGEERRFPGPRGALFGSRFYLDRLDTAERKALRGVVNVDMIGNGPIVRVCHQDGALDRRLLTATLLAAARLNIPHREEVISRFISDHLPFQRAGIPVSWLYAGEHPSVHTRRDTVEVVRSADVERIGRVTWETLRTFAG